MIPYGRHNISDDDIAAVTAALRGDYLTTGPLVEAFELALQNLVQAPCVAVSSGTAALHCAYAAIGLEKGDEVITPPMTFVATQATAVNFGAKIVFADIQADTGNIDPRAVEAAITSKTRAIVAVDFAGHPADLDELRQIADRKGVFLIEDAAHSIGSLYKQKPVGSIADLTTFSFFPTKNMTTAEGGAIASTNPDLLEKAKRFSRQGLVRNPAEFRIKGQGVWHQEVHHFGLNYRLPDVLCALGVSQLKRIHEFKSIRSAIFDSYSEKLSSIEGVVLPESRAYNSPMWHLYPIHVNSKSREEIFNNFRKQGIGVQINYLPAYRHPAFEEYGYTNGMFPVSDSFYESEISLPMWISNELLEEEYLEKVSKILRTG
jgi:dTDP-4-amino-4,6-dideoxygalactose transaminase